MAFDFINSSEIIPSINTDETGNMETGKISVSSTSPYNEIINQLISESPEDVPQEKTEEAKDLLTKSDFVAFMEKYQINASSLERAFNPDKTPSVSDEILKFLEGLKNKETTIETNNSIKEFIESNIAKEEIKNFYNEKIQEKTESLVSSGAQVASISPLIIETKTEISSTILPDSVPPTAAALAEKEKTQEEITNSVTIVTKEQEIEKKTEALKKVEVEKIIETQNKEFEKTKEVLSSLISAQTKNKETNTAETKSETTSTVNNQTTILGTQIEPDNKKQDAAPKVKKSQEEILAQLTSSTKELDSIITSNIKEGDTNVNKTDVGAPVNISTQETVLNENSITENKTDVLNTQTTLNENSKIQNTQTEVKPAAKTTAPAVQTPSTQSQQAAAVSSSETPAPTPVSTVPSTSTSTSTSSGQGSISLDALEKTMEEMLEIQKQLVMNMQIVAATLQSPLMVIDTGRTQI
jgi:hypothetical protein